MMRYFVNPVGRIVCECVSDAPVNSAGLEIVEFQELHGNPYDYVVQGGVPVFSPQAKTSEQLRAEAKSARTAAVAAITVTTTSGKVFDGDETSQTRMARAIIGLQAAGVPTISWTLANNTIVDATVAELTEAMILAGQQQAALWPIPE